MKNEKFFYSDANKLNGWAMSLLLTYDEITFDRNIELQVFLNNPDDCDIGFFHEIDLFYPDNTKEETNFFPFCPENRKLNPDKKNDYMKNLKPKHFIKTKKLICDWTDKKKKKQKEIIKVFDIKNGEEIT